MNTKAIFTIVAIVAAIGMLGVVAVATEMMMTAPQAHAYAGGHPGCAPMSSGDIHSKGQCLKS